LPATLRPIVPTVPRPYLSSQAAFTTSSWPLNNPDGNF